MFDRGGCKSCKIFISYKDAVSHPVPLCVLTAGEPHPCEAERCIGSMFFLYWRDQEDLCLLMLPQHLFQSPQCHRKYPGLIYVGAGNALKSMQGRKYYYLHTCPESPREQMTNSRTELSYRALLSNTVAPAHFPSPAIFHLMHTLELH